MGIFEDWEYPDNENRARRAGELANDVATLISQLSTDRSAIDTQLENADEAIKACYESLEQGMPDIKLVNVELGQEWVVDIIELLDPFLVYPAVAYGLERAAVSFLLKEGRIGEAGLARLVGLPSWFTFGKFVGGVAAVFAVAAIVDAISGAARKDKLRDMIHEQIEPRIIVERAAMVNKQLSESLASIIMTFDTLKELGIYTEEQLNQALQSLLDKERANIEVITDDTAKEALAVLDNNRGSWTKEDMR